jgi:catechol 2,3-dioxygenase-like lactoylglutathione lyase family enzyme
MITAIDHLVIVVSDLDAASADYRALGFTVVAGGRHERHVGTHNTLIAFADGSYMELIGFYEPQPSHRWWDALQRGEGLVDFCLQTDDLAGDARVLRRAGIDMGEPEPKTRRRPDGVEVRWSYALARGAHRGVAPFIIADSTPREVRVPREHRHANGATGIGTVTVAVEDVGAVSQWYAEALHRPGTAVERPDIDARGMRFGVGPHRFDLVAPAGTASPLRAWLAARGSSPYAATITGGTPRGALDPARCHGARLAFE